MDEQTMEIVEPTFTVDDDGKADWAVTKVLEAYAERDRLLDLIETKRSELDAKEQSIKDRCERETEWLISQLHNYMATVPTKKTATQESYKLLSGTIVAKKPKVDVAAGDGLLDWLLDNRPDLVKVDRRADWAKVKSLVKEVADGCYVLEDTGEIVDGIIKKEIPGKFEVRK